MAKILLTPSYFYRLDPKQWKTAQPYPPLGTLYAAAVLREAGHRVSLFDSHLALGPEEIQPFLEKEKPDYLVVYDDGFNYLTKMCLTNMREAAFRLASFGKDKGCTVIISSSDATDHPEKYLSEGANYVILGEGEITLRELITTLESPAKAVKDVAGIACMTEEGVYVSSQRSVLRDLDSLPQAAWDLIDIRPYRSIQEKKHGYFSLNIATTRGCPFKCNWCAKPIYGNRYHSRSPEKVADEIEMLIQKFDVNYFWMCDDIFGLKPGWVQAFRDEVRRRNLSFRYKIQSRVDLLLEGDTLDALAGSGLDTVWVGAESGSQKILDAMDKGTKVEQIFETRRLLGRKGIKVGFFLQFGYLGETREDIQKTLDMVLELMPDEIGISVSYPLPGTKFYEKVKSQLGTKANWKDSDDLAMMFRSEFSPHYYKRLHRYVHKIYRRKQGWESLRKIFSASGKVKSPQIRAALSTLYYIPTSIVDKIQLTKLERMR
ncbi:MAG: radical SAM protein [Bacteroidia bacterium]|nr:radical SAM protein [Bacteroidia bacterium]